MTTSNNPSRTDSLHGDGRDPNDLVYKFDSTRPWQYFVHGGPVASSVEKGRRKLVTSRKFQKTYVAKDRRTILRRKNAPFRDINQLLLTCCHSGCLLRRGAFLTRNIIRGQRNTVYQKSYNEQNYFLSKLMEIKVTEGGKRRVDYTIPRLGKVCRTAFRKCYGFSSSKIQLLLKKIHLDDPSVEPDQRGQRTPRKFLPLVKNMVINFICSYEASESHYRKSRTNAKKYFDS